MAFRIDDNVAVEAFAAGGGLEILIVAEGEVQHAALAAAHGSKAVGLAGAADALGGGFRGKAQLAGAQGFEIFGVKGDFVVLLVFEAQDFGGDVLERTEQLAAALREQAGIGPGEFDVDLAGFESGGIGGAGSGGDAVLQTQPAQGRQGPEEFCDFLCGCGVIFDRHRWVYRVPT